MNKHGIFQQTIDTHDAAWWHVPSLLRCIGLCIGLLSPMVTLADGDFAQLSPTFYSFPATAIGNSSTDHALTFTNTGSASLHIIGAQVPGQFPITSNNCPSDLGVGASCVFNVNFMPAAAGDQAGTLTVFTASGNLIANLSGVGFDPAAPAQLSPLSYDYGTIVVGGHGATHAFLLANYGSAPLTVTGAAVPAEFPIDSNNCPGTLLTGASCFFDVYFSPTASGARNGTLTVYTSAGNIVASLSGTGGGIDSSPSPISFTPLDNAARNTVVTSNSVAIAEINTPIAVMVSGGTYAINGGSYTDVADSVNAGDTITVRQTSSGSFNTTTIATLTLGSGSDAQSADFTVTTMSADTAPDAFGFGNRSGVAPGSVQTSNTVMPGGFNGATTISVSGGSYAVNGGAFTSSSGNINPGDSVAVRFTASAQFSTATSVQLTIGGVTGSFTVTTIAADTTPDAFTFSAATDVMPNSEQISNTVTISGLNTSAPITVNGGNYSINSGTFMSAAGSIGNGDTVAVRQTASSSFSTTTAVSLTVGGVSADYTVSTTAAMSDPAAFTFGAVTGVAPASVQTSGTVTVSGTNTASAIHVSGGTYAVNGGAFTSSAGTVQPGDSIAARTTASTAFSSTVTVTLTIGATTGTYTVTTLAADTTPDAFSFGSVSGVLPDSVQTSETIVISGINTASPVSIGSGQYRINDGAYTDAAGTVVTGDHVTLRKSAPSGFGETTQATLTIGGVSGNFAVTTTTADTIPDTFTIPAISDAVPGSTVHSEIVVIGGINAPTTYTISNGCLQSSAGPDCITGGTLDPGDSFQIVVHSSDDYCQSVSGSATIGGVSSTFTVKTSCDLPEVRVKAGGGSLGSGLLLIFGALALLRRLRLKPGHHAQLAFGGLLLACNIASAQALDADRVYGGIRLGQINTNMPHALTQGLRHRGYSDVRTSGDDSSFGNSFHVGYAFLPNLDFELGYTHADDPDVRLHGTATPGTDFDALLRDAGQLASGYGDRYSASIRMPVSLTSRISVAPRLGVLFTDSSVRLRTDNRTLKLHDNGGGYGLGVDLRYLVWRGLHIGASTNYADVGHTQHSIEYAALIEWQR